MVSTLFILIFLLKNFLFLLGFLIFEKFLRSFDTRLVLFFFSLLAVLTSCQLFATENAVYSSILEECTQYVDLLILVCVEQIIDP